MTIARPSAASLMLEMLDGNERVARGTGFVVVSNRETFLITNRHNVTGRDEKNQPVGQTGAIPQSVAIWHKVKNSGRLKWTRAVEDLYSAPGSPRWFEHPQHGKMVDVIALPLTIPTDVALAPYDPTAAQRSQVAVAVTTEVQIVGFPFGLTVGGRLAIWSRGTIATEPEIDFDGLPQFLVDSRTRTGQSGSPVIFWSHGGSVALAGGGSGMRCGQPIELLLGVYSSRVNKDSDLGRVWKTRVIPEILAARHRPPGESLAAE